MTLISTYLAVDCGLWTTEAGGGGHEEDSQNIIAMMIHRRRRNTNEIRNVESETEDDHVL